MSRMRLENVNFSYVTESGLTVHALKNVNLSVEPGELLAIQGPSGSGKSTLLYVLGCLLSSYQGKVFINEQDVSKLSDEQLAFLRNKTIGFIFQQFHLLSKATVLENILLPAQYPVEWMEEKQLEARKQRAVEIAQSLGIADRLDHFPNQLSGGQQQRVSIARALLNDTQIILADEPTGSLDSKNARQILDILKDISQQGRTVILITHDPELAKECQRTVFIKDGVLHEDEAKRSSAPIKKYTQDALPAALPQEGTSLQKTLRSLNRYFATAKKLFPTAFASLKQNKSRSALTMLGIVIGIASVLSMMTVGSFTKEKILDSYAELGVNTLVFYGNQNWDVRATDRNPATFQAFDWEREILPLKNIFPEIKRMSPMYDSWSNTVNYGGKSVQGDANVYGVSFDGLHIARRELAMGKFFSPFQITYRSAVCIIGYEVFENLFVNKNPLGQVIYITQDDKSYGCMVVGVLKSVSSNKEWNKPNLHVYLPYTFFKEANSSWESRLSSVVLEIREGHDVERAGNVIRAFFEKKYGTSGRFRVDSDSKLVSQMNKFLTLFTILLAAISLVSLAVGGIGITNMMLVSVAERFKEIGIRKAFGATNFSIRVQYLLESILLCALAGVIGLVLGVALYQMAIYGATKLTPKLSYEWVLDVPALLFSVGSIFLVGVLSGLVPALRAEKLQVIEALRSE